MQDDGWLVIQCYYSHFKEIKWKCLDQYNKAIKILALLYTTKKAYDIYEISVLCFNEEPSFAILGYMHDIAVFLDIAVTDEASSVFSVEDLR